MEASSPVVSSESVALRIFTSVRFELFFTLCALGCWALGSALRRRTRGKVPRKLVDDHGAVSVGRGPSAQRGARQRTNAGAQHIATPSGSVVLRHNAGPDEVLHSYETAMSQGDKVLQSLSQESLSKLFAEVLPAAIRTGRSAKLPQYLKHAIKLGCSPTPQQIESLVKMCTAKKFFKDALAAFDAFTPDGDEAESFTAATWSCLLFCAVESGQFERCEALYKPLQKLRAPSCDDFMNMLRYVVHTRNQPRIVTLLREMRESGAPPNNIAYNRALAVCVAAEQLEMAEELLSEMSKYEGVSDVITYNTLIKGYAQVKKIDRCFELEKEMKARSIEPSEVTYGILLDACIGADQLEKAAQVFKDFQASGRQLNAVLYTTLLKGLARAGQPDQAMMIFEQMCDSGIKPDLVAFSVLIKVHCDAGKVETALQLLERMCGHGLAPDEIVFNNLLLGCVERKNLQLGSRILSDMQHTIKPSQVTISIMLKLFGACREWDMALDLLNTSHAKLGLPCEARLYIQLAQGCIRNRQGKKVLEVCDALLRNCKADEQMLGRLVNQCISFNMLDTGAEICERTLVSGAKIHARDVEALLAAAAKKKKQAIIQSTLTLMQRFNIHVDDRWRSEANVSG